jgi:hypothetical protein
MEIERRMTMDRISTKVLEFLVALYIVFMFLGSTFMLLGSVALMKYLGG